jgi:HlyD family secretion protein
MDDPEVARLISGETKLFETPPQDPRGPQVAARRARAAVEEEIRGLTAQIASKEKQIEWIQQELEGVRDLWNKKLVQFNRVTSLEREQRALTASAAS